MLPAPLAEPALFAAGWECAAVGPDNMGGSQQTGRNPMWEYKVVEGGMGTKSVKYEAVLNAAANEGWRLVAVGHLSQMFLERPKP